MSSTFNVLVRLSSGQAKLVMDLLDEATDEHDDPVTVAGARRKIRTAYDRARTARQRNQEEHP